MAESRLLLCLFHLNLAYSSIEAERRPELVRRCYWPLLDLAQRDVFPIAIEGSGWTFEEIARIDPEWIDACRDLVAQGKVEVVGSTYTQAAMPLLPAEVNAWNLRLGLEVYERLLSAPPRVGLVPEQAYSPGTVDLFAEAGYGALVADWDNAYRSHLDWPESHRRFPQLALGCNAALPVLWSQSIAFQKFQRYAHADMTLDEYLDFVQGICARGPGVLMLYANDAEIFDFRPGRFAAEPPLAAEEWSRIENALREIRVSELGRPGLPSQALELLDAPEAGHPLRLEAAAEPIPVKKQEKYNVARWACTGRDDIGANTRCWRIYDRLRATGEEDPEAWRDLCRLWASDFRTHITEARWQGYTRDLEAAERRAGVSAPPPRARPVAPADIERVDDLLTLRADGLELVLNARRGLAVHRFVDRSVCDEPLVGTVPHGYFDTIDLGADWYTGTLVQEAPHRHKVADLGRAEVDGGFLPDGRLAAASRIETELGHVEKLVTLDPEARTFEVEYVLHWTALPPGSLRLAYVTLLPDAFEPTRLWYAAHNGGRELERHELGGVGFDHGAAVSALVSSRQGLGATEGIVQIGDDRRAVCVDSDRTASAGLALVSFRPATPGFLLRLCWSLAEEDDTRRGAIPCDEPRLARFRIAARRTSELERERTTNSVVSASGYGHTPA
jgi:Glycosyl hydrolase family 57